MVNKINFVRRPAYCKETIDAIVSALDAQGISSKNVRSNNQHIDCDILFRWGFSGYYNAKYNVEINSPRSISISANKRSSRILLQQEGFSVPQSFVSISEVPQNLFPVIIRPEYHHAGQDIIIAEDSNVKIPYSPYYVSQYMKKTREIRAYIFNSRIFGMADKIPKDINAIAWNHAQGGSFQNIRWGNWPMEGAELALKSSEFLGLNFSAVDLMFYEDRWYILELNTAPTLTPYRINCFVKALVGYINGNIYSMPESYENYESTISPELMEEN